MHGRSKKDSKQEEKSSGKEDQSPWAHMKTMIGIDRNDTEQTECFRGIGNKVDRKRK